MQSESRFRRRFSVLLSFAAVLVVTVGSVSTAAATTMPYTTLPELVEISDVVVRGTVVGEETFVSDRTGRITTHTRVAVETTYAGEVRRNPIVVEQWGGTVDGRTLEIPGNAHYREGEDVILFLEFDREDRSNPLYLVAMTQAKFHVESTDDGPMVSRSTSGVEMVGDAGSGDLEQPTPLEAFVTRIASLVEGDGSDGEEASDE